MSCAATELQLPPLPLQYNNTLTIININCIITAAVAHHDAFIALFIYRLSLFENKTIFDYVYYSKQTTHDRRRRYNNNKNGDRTGTTIIRV